MHFWRYQDVLFRAATHLPFVVVLQNAVWGLILFVCFSPYGALYPQLAPVDPQRFQGGSPDGWGNVFQFQDRNSGS